MIQSGIDLIGGAAILKSNNRLNLDIQALRAYAITITIVAHLGFIIPSWTKWTSYFWLGGGVDLFFALSGFLIVGQLLSLADNRDSFRSFARSFWIKRIFRLWPSSIFWGCLVLLISASVTVRSFGRDTFLSWLFGILNVENFYISTCVQMTSPCMPAPLWHYWTLSLEEQFYFVVPFAIFFVRNRVVLLVCFLIAAVVQSFTVRQWGYLLWFVRSDALLYGSSIAIIWHLWPTTMKKLFDRVPPIAARCALVVFCAALVVGSRVEISQYFMGIVSISAGLIILLASADRDMIPRWRFLAYVGSRSYSIYVLHFPVFLIFNEIASPTSKASEVMLVALSLAASFAASEFSYRFIETPLRDFGRGVAGFAISSEQVGGEAFIGSVNNIGPG